MRWRRWSHARPRSRPDLPHATRTYPQFRLEADTHRNGNLCRGPQLAGSLSRPFGFAELTTDDRVAAAAVPSDARFQAVRQDPDSAARRDRRQQAAVGRIGADQGATGRLPGAPAAGARCAAATAEQSRGAGSAVKGAGTTPPCCRGLRQRSGSRADCHRAFSCIPFSGDATRQAGHLRAVVRVGFLGIGRSTPMARGSGGSATADWREPASSGRLPIHRSESPTGYSSAGCSPVEPASASPVTVNSSSIAIRRGNQIAAQPHCRDAVQVALRRVRRQRECHLYFARRVSFLTCADTRPSLKHSGNRRLRAANSMRAAFVVACQTAVKSAA
jgi:hypothetical protein